MQRTDSSSAIPGVDRGTPKLIVATSRIPTGSGSLPRHGGVVRFNSTSLFGSTTRVGGPPSPSPTSPSPTSSSPSSSAFSEDTLATATGTNSLKTPPGAPKNALGLDMAGGPALRNLGGYSRDSTASLPGGVSLAMSNAAYAAAAAREDNCLVTVRMRPPSYSELSEKVVWNVDGEQKIRLDPLFADMNRRLHSEYVYDSVLQGSDNEEAYASSVKNMIPHLMEGYHVTVFAYGQTASGKTYTMTGMEDQPGIIPQAVDDVFEYIRIQCNDNKEYLVRVSYLEIYNEQIRDLLQPELTDLRILEDKRRGVYVSPLKEEIVTSAKQVLHVIQRGELNRHTSTTDYNEYSSRSHTIFQMVIESREQTTPKNSPLLPNGKRQSDGTVRVSQLNLIDLAGSEKAATDIDRRKEGAYINKSLLTLGTVISRLTETPRLIASGHMAGTPSPGHIPYRDSKLTRILQSSLSGNAKISVICTISPTAASYEESNNTLKFAARVKHVVLNAKANRIMDDKALIQKYRTEILELRHKLLTIETVKDNELKVEKRKYEKQIVEEQMIRTTLKERIDHLQRMILTSSGMQARTLLEGGPNFGTSSSSIPPQSALTRKPSVNEISGDVETFQKILDLKHTVTERDSLISNLQREMEYLRSANSKMSGVIEAVSRGDLVTAQSLATELGPLEAFFGNKGGDGMMEDADGEMIMVPRTEYNNWKAELAIREQKLVDMANRVTGFQDRSKSLESMLIQRTKEMRELQGELEPASARPVMSDDFTPASTTAGSVSGDYEPSVSGDYEPSVDGSPLSRRRLPDPATNVSMDSSNTQRQSLMLSGLMTSLMRLDDPSELSLDGVEPPLDVTEEEPDEEDDESDAGGREDEDETF